MKINYPFYLFLFSLIIVSFRFEAQNTNNLNLNNNKYTVILSDENEIRISGVKSDFIYYHFSSKKRIKVLSEKGIEKYSEVTLPEQFDPTYIIHAPETRNYQNVYSNMKIKHFNVSIIKQSGDTIVPKVKRSVETLKMVRENNRYGNYDKFYFKIPRLEKGDELVLDYNYSVKYIEDFYRLSSFRIFFNSDIYKKNYSLNIKYNKDLMLTMEAVNCSDIDTIITNDKIQYSIKYSNLDGCLNEYGSRPYLSLPYVTINVKSNSQMYQLPYSYEERYIPSYALYAKHREKKHLDILRAIHNGVSTEQYLKINQYIERITNGIENDSTGKLKLEKIHNDIVNNFRFEEDLDYFKLNDNRDERLGDFLQKKVIRDISRYNLYVALISELGLDYFTVYLADKRSGEISNDYIRPMYENDYLLAVVLKNGQLQFVYPKKADFGYYLNELPFYYEDTKARLVHRNDYYSLENPNYQMKSVSYHSNMPFSKKDSVSEEFRSIYTPKSKMSENIRVSNIEVNVDKKDSKLIFNSKTTLSGQYATMTRGFYEHDFKHKTINSLYNHKIWEINDNVEIESTQIKVLNSESPYQTGINATYSCENIMNISNNTISISLNNWFKHIIYENLDTENRILDFFSDFCGRDTYTYILNFDSEIKIISNKIDTLIENQFGYLKIKIEQSASNQVKVFSDFETRSKMIHAKDIHIVKEIYDQILLLDNYNLLLKIE